VLEVRPFNEIGTPVEIVRRFGGKRGFEEAVQGLAQMLYAQ
jgi:type I restriction enzyme R subunit